MRFPALHGRASLKRRNNRTAGGEMGRFPALHGRASLKPAVRGAPSHVSSVFPPFTGGPH